MNAPVETKTVGNRQIIPFINEDAGVSLQTRRERVAVNTAAVYFMRPVYQWLSDLLSIFAQSVGLSSIAPLMAYAVAQSAVNPTNASITVWRMMSTEGDDELRLRSVISAVQTYRSPENMADRSLGVDALVESFTAWLTDINQPDGPDLMDLPQFILGPIAAMSEARTVIAEWQISSMGPHEENKNYFMVTLQRWDLQLDILVDYRELAAMAVLIQMCEADDDAEELPPPPAEVNVEMLH